MKRWMLGAMALAVVFGMIQYTRTAGFMVKNTFAETPSEEVEERIGHAGEITLRTYYEMRDGTWKTDEHTYQYKLVITGRLNSAVRDTTYTYLSNQKDISFEKAWKASGLSSNSADYFQAEDAVLVAIQ